jgi:hypothetical protein
MDENKTIADNIAASCKYALSARAYRNWAAVAAMLLKKGFDPEECEAILRSKWTRWARDASFKDYAYGKYPAKVLEDYIDNMVREHGLTHMCARVRELVEGRVSKAVNGNVENS